MCIRDRFYFSLVRQYEAENDGYNQIHIDVIYPPTNRISDLSRADWIENVDELDVYKRQALSREPPELKHLSRERKRNQPRFR